jgi:hypothetical protein
MPRGGARPGAGRKPTRPVSARRVMLDLSAAEARRLQALQERSGQTASAVLRALLMAAALLVLLTACDAPSSLEHDTDQPLTSAPTVDGETPTHGFWAYRRWPTLVLDEAGSCPVEAVEAALAPFRAAGIDVAYEAGVCRPDHWYVEDGRVCLRTDDDALWEDRDAGHAWWRPRLDAEDQIVTGGITVWSSCNPMVIAHEVGHLLGLGHSDDRAHTMYPAESDVLAFGERDLPAIVARRAEYLAAEQHR